jgi:hypothetical protein
MTHADGAAARAFMTTLCWMGAMLVVMHGMYLWDRGFFLEDRVIENAQAVLLLLAGLTALVRSRQDAWRRYAWLYRTLAVVALVLLLEELSYGQRIIGFATPALVAAKNTQREFNFHNLWFGMVDRVVMGAIGVVSLAVVALRRAKLAVPLEPRLIPAASNRTYLLLAFVSAYYYVSGLLIFAFRVFPTERSYMELHETLFYGVLVLLVNTRPADL